VLAQSLLDCERDAHKPRELLAPGLPELALPLKYGRYFLGEKWQKLRGMLSMLGMRDLQSLFAREPTQSPVQQEARIKATVLLPRIWQNLAKFRPSFFRSLICTTS